jgi:hypothetical protein
MGAKAYRIIETLRPHLAGNVVEIGAEGGEGSTRFLADFCHQTGLPFYSVDFEQGAFERAKNIPHVRAVMMRGETFLEEMLLRKGGPICFAYLDNFDWVWNMQELNDPQSFYHSLIHTYRHYGLNMNNLNSQITHLRQAMLLEKLAASSSYVLLDDTWAQPDGTFCGKGGAAVPYLMACGFQPRPADISGPAILLGRP